MDSVSHVATNDCRPMSENVSREIPCMLNRCSGSEWRTVDPRVFCTEVELGLHSLKRSLEQSQEHQGSYCKDENE